MPTGQDWLMALLGGVGGAFTGYGQDKEVADARALRQAAQTRQGRLDDADAFTQRIQQRAALDAAGFRPTASMAAPPVRPTGMPGMLGAVPTEAMVGTMRRGETLRSPDGGSYTLDRLSTPSALAERERQTRAQEARAEIERRAAERREDMAFTQKRDAAAQANARALAGIRTTGTTNRAEQSLKAKRSESFREAEEQMQMLNDTITRIENNESAFGAKNYLPSAVRMRLPWRDTTADADAIGSLEFVVGELRHGRFGGALTPSEAERAARIFSEPTAPSEAIIAQLNAVRRALMMRQRSLSGSRAPQRSTGNTAPDANVPDPEQKFTLPYPD